MTLRQRMASVALKALGADAFSQIISSIVGNASTTPRMGSKELLRAYSTMPWLRAVVGKISWQAGSVPWQLYVATAAPEPGKGKERRARRFKALQRCTSLRQRMVMYKALRDDDALKEITEHGFLDLIDRGNTKMSGAQVMQLTYQHLDLVGESAWVMDRNGLSVPTDLWPIPTTWVQDMPRPGRDTYMVVAPTGMREVPAQDIVWFYHPDPSDPYARGTGTGHALGDELETDEYAAKHLKGWFYNRARPDILVTGAGLNKGDLDRMEEKWLQKLSGAGKAGQKPYFINRDVKVDVISQSFGEMQLSQLRKDERDAIVHVYGLSPEALGIIENSNRSTIDAADYMVAKYVLQPRLEFMRTKLQLLVEMFDERLILDYINPVQEDKEYELKVMTASPASFTVDEWRAQAGKKPMPDAKIGEGHIVPMTNTFVESLDELAEQTVPPGPEGGEGALPGALGGIGGDPEDDEDDEDDAEED